MKTKNRRDNMESMIQLVTLIRSGRSYKAVAKERGLAPTGLSNIFTKSGLCYKVIQQKLMRGEAVQDIAGEMLDNYKASKISELERRAEKKPPSHSMDISLPAMQQKIEFIDRNVARILEVVNSLSEDRMYYMPPPSIRIRDKAGVA